MGKPHKKSLMREALDRLDGLMAIGESRRAAKDQARADGERLWTFSTGRMHSFKTRTTYQEHILRFLTWARQAHDMKHLADADLRADVLATEYLAAQLADGKSPYTIQTIRSALRLFFANRTLAATIVIPKRTRSIITRSRGPVANDSHFQPANWQELIRFLQATGLRRSEVQFLRVRDISLGAGRSAVQVRNGKGGKAREVPVLAGSEAAILAVVSGRLADELVFARIPRRLDVHALRREYAQALYLHYVECNSPLEQVSLPPATGVLPKGSYDVEAVRRVSWALGHNRLDVVLNHYLR